MNYTSPIRIELPSIFGMKTVNAYLFTDPEPILIDCGEKTDKSWEVLGQALKEHKLGIKDLKKLVITHAHVDHLGAAGRICEESDAEILLPIYAKGWALNLDEMRRQRIDLILHTLSAYKIPEDSLLAQTFGNIVHAFRDFWDPLPESRLSFIQDKDMLEMGGKNWEVLYTPGHCINQCCFFQAEEKEFISADMLLSITPTPVIDASLEPPYQRVRGILQQLASYERIRQLDIQKVYPGHYESFGNAKQLIDYQVNRIHVRKEEVYGYLSEGEMSIHDIFFKMYGKNFTGWPMLLGYMDLLEKEGRIARSLNNSIIEISCF